MLGPREMGAGSVGLITGLAGIWLLRSAFRREAKKKKAQEELDAATRKLEATAAGLDAALKLLQERMQRPGRPQNPTE